MFKRVLSFILMAALCFGVFPTATSTVVSQNVSAMNESIDVTADTSFGEMLASTIEDDLASQQENNGYRIFSLEIAGTVAFVEMEALDDCLLVVGIYSEDGTEMLTSGHLEVTAEDKEVLVNIETDAMPTYFLAKAFLVNENTEPLCPAYSTPNYTQEMQEFFAKTVDDFDADRVLNLDDDPTSNFAVFSEDVVMVNANTNGQNILTVDEATDTYIFENADDTVKSLAVGDTLTCTDENGNVLIVVIANIQVNGDTVTLTGGDGELEEVFDYIKLEGSAGLDESAIDGSTCDEGVSVDGIELPDARTRAIDIGGSTGVSAKHTLREVKVGNGIELSGSVNFGLTASVELYVTLSYCSLEVKLDYEAGLHVSVTGKADMFKIKLAQMTISPVLGVYIVLTPSFVGAVSSEVDLSGTLEGTIGFGVNTRNGIKNLTSTPSFKAEVKGEITVFLGFSLEPKVTLVSDKLAEASMTATAGAEIKGAMSASTESTDFEHQCRACLDGDISGKLELSFEAKFLNSKKWSFKLNLLDATIKIFDFYWSVDHQEFGFTSCPHIAYLVEATVKCSDGSLASGAKVVFDSAGYFADAISGSNGVAAVYLPNGTYAVSASFENESGAAEKALKVKNKARKVTVKMSNPEDSESGNTESNSSQAAPISMGTYHSATIAENGDLYIWGGNTNGQLGNGTTENSATPIKIMEQVKAVSLGHVHSAAITENGNLYMWGDNFWGQLGNGTIEDSAAPIKLMEHVKAVSLGYHHSAAITENGDLYMWGYNPSGELGNGTTKNSLIPTKIMEHVEFVTLNGGHSAAIAENGDLYMWGSNEFGELGNGTNESSATPIKIMEQVKTVSLGHDHSAAITENGNLYTWGENFWGQLGNGTTDNSTVPIKIMEQVKSVSLGRYHSAAITENGDLHTWGWNDNGKLGNGTDEDSYTLIKIMEDVETVSLGAYHSAAITENGDLYMWGYNLDGELGNGTTEDSHVPIQITIPQTARARANLPLAARTVGAQTADFGDLVPGALYNFYVMRDRDVEIPFAADNLLYIDQAAADSAGNLSFSYIPREMVTDADVFISRFYTEPRPDDAQPDDTLLGDVNSDGKVNTTDARFILQYAAGILGEDDLNLDVADVNGDGKVNTTDARSILQFAAGIIDRFPAEDM